jgi:3-oxoacyl-(acyl-carrier-protein) synthase
MQKIVCVVAYEGIYPDAANVDQLYRNLLAGHVTIKNFLSQDQTVVNHDFPFFHSKDPKSKNKTSSLFGSAVDRRKLHELVRGRPWNPLMYTNTQVAALEVAHRIFDPILPKLRDQKVDCILGCSAVDNEAGLRKEEKLLKTTASKNLVLLKEKGEIDERYYELATATLKVLREHFPLSGVAFFTDAACASSFSAIYCAYNRLLNGKADFVLSGGIDLNFGPFLQTMFSKAGVLSHQTMTPFDENAHGMNPSEAAAFVLLTTTDKAKELGLPVLGIIEDCEGASDGLKGGATEPTLQGQLLAYTKAYGERSRSVDFIEAHGTGTIVGDKIEVQSLSEFFDAEVPVGSVKAHIGHTIAAAGASSVTKVLKIFAHRMVPGLPLFNQLPKGVHTKLRFSKANSELKPEVPLRAGLSSFGFGGTNFHMVMSSENYPIETPKLPAVSPAQATYLVASETMSFDEITSSLGHSLLKIPPITIRSIDHNILGAMLCLEKLIIRHGIYLDEEARIHTHVLSAGNLALRIARDLADVLMYEHASSLDEKITVPPELTALEFTADSSTGILNNLIAGRASKAFDFKGVNFHIDADTGSRIVAIDVADDILKKKDGAVFVISTIESFDQAVNRLDQKGVRIELFATKSFILANDLPVSSKLESVNV